MNSQTKSIVVELDAKARELNSLTQEILGDSFVRLSVQKLQLEENFETGKAIAQVDIVESKGNAQEKRTIKGEGVGLIDAFFEGMLKAYAQEHKSLINISLVDFNVATALESRKTQKTDALAKASLRICNSDKFEFAFSCKTPSISQSSLAVVLESISFFVNGEHAYVKLHVALNDAKARSRFDLVERFQHHMASLVHVTSYHDVAKTLSTK